LLRSIYPKVVANNNKTAVTHVVCDHFDEMTLTRRSRLAKSDMPRRKFSGRLSQRLSRSCYCVCGTLVTVTTALNDLLVRHVEAGIIPGAVAVRGVWRCGGRGRWRGLDRRWADATGGQGTDFFVDPEGTIGILLTQVELGERVWPLVEEFQALGETST
jgi:hypothetical protein